MYFYSPIAEMPVAYFYTYLSLVQEASINTDKIGSFVGERRRVYLSAAYQF